VPCTSLRHCIPFITPDRAGPRTTRCVSRAAAANTTSQAHSRAAPRGNPQPESTPTLQDRRASAPSLCGRRQQRALHVDGEAVVHVVLLQALHGRVHVVDGHHLCSKWIALGWVTVRVNRGLGEPSGAEPYFFFRTSTSQVRLCLPQKSSISCVSLMLPIRLPPMHSLRAARGASASTFALARLVRQAAPSSARVYGRRSAICSRWHLLAPFTHATCSTSEPRHTH